MSQRQLRGLCPAALFYALHDGSCNALWGIKSLRQLSTMSNIKLGRTARCCLMENFLLASEMASPTGFLNHRLLRSWASEVLFIPPAHAQATAWLTAGRGPGWIRTFCSTGETS